MHVPTLRTCMYIRECCAKLDMVRLWLGFDHLMCVLMLASTLQCACVDASQYIVVVHVLMLASTL